MQFKSRSSPQEQKKAAKFDSESLANRDLRRDGYQEEIKKPKEKPTGAIHFGQPPAMFARQSVTDGGCHQLSFAISVLYRTAAGSSDGSVLPRMTTKLKRGNLCHTRETKSYIILSNG